MKKLLTSPILFVAILAIGILTGCAGFGTSGTTPTAPVTLTPAQIATALCGPTKSIVAILQADTGIAGSGQSVLTSVSPKINAICSDASTVTSNSAQSLISFAFDSVLPIVNITHPELAQQLLTLQAIVGVVEATIPAPASVSPAVVPAAGPAAK